MNKEVDGMAETFFTHQLTLLLANKHKMKEKKVPVQNLDNIKPTLSSAFCVNSKEGFYLIFKAEISTLQFLALR